MSAGNDAGVALSIFNRNGGATTCEIFGSGAASFAGNITAGNVTFNLEPDNPANYTTTTDSEGNETQVYNGPTLDVKERLTRTDEFVRQLRSAVQNATTFDGLRTAMAVALDDYVNSEYWLWL